MKANKTLTEKALLFQRLKKRWSKLPTNMVFDLVMNHEINEKALDNNRHINLRREIANARKKNTNG